MTSSATDRAVDAVWRIESARLIAGLTRIVRDVAVAEDLAQDALVAALEQWPESGIPENPGAWLMATAKRRGIDALRRRVALERKQELIGRELEILQQLDRSDLTAQVEDVRDDLLRPERDRRRLGARHRARRDAAQNPRPRAGRLRSPSQTTGRPHPICVQHNSPENLVEQAVLPVDHNC